MPMHIVPLVLATAFFTHGHAVYAADNAASASSINTTSMNSSGSIGLSLADAEQKFRANSRELLAAKRDLEGYQADTLSAAQKPNPVLSMGVSSFNLNRSEGNRNASGNNSLADKTLNSGLQVNQLIERGNKRELRMAAAQDAVRASQLIFKDTLRQQKLALRTAYYDLLLAQESEQIQNNNVALYQNTLQAADLRLKAGDIASTDVSRIRVDALRAMNDARQAVAEHEKAQANLAYLIGAEQASASIVATDPWPNIDLQPDASDTSGVTFNTNIDSSTISQRADIQAAQARAQQAEENRKLAQALKTRDLTVGLQYQHFPGQQPGAGDDTIGASLSIPLYTNYQYQGEIARSEVEYTAATEAREQTQAAALGEIARARADLNAASEKVRRFDQQMLSEAQKAADAAEFAYRNGAMGVTDLLDSRRILRALQLEAVSVRADYAKSLAEWQAATSTESDL